MRAAGTGGLTLIRPGRWQGFNLHEIWEYRELLWFLALRDIRLRYKQTALGVAWAVLQPILMMLAFTLFFGRLGGLNRTLPGNVSYAVFALSGLLPWQFFAFALNAAGQSLIANQSLITKVYCPRLILPLASIVPGLVDFAASLLLLGIMLAYRGIPFRVSGLLGIPLAMTLAVVAATAVGLWLAVLSAEYRDARHTLPLLTQVWLLMSPVAYPSTVIPAQWRIVYGLNPMATVVETFRWATLGTSPPPLGMTLSSAAVTLALLAGALIHFRRNERLLADVI